MAEEKHFNIKTEFTCGMRDAVPIGLAYFAVSFTFGMMASEMGIGIWQAAFFSLTNLTSAGQFAALPMIVSGAAYAEMALTQLVINLRYLLMSFSLSQKIPTDTGAGQRLLMSYGVTDEIFGISAARQGRLCPWYTVGATVISCAGWVLGTTAGAVSSSLLPESVISAMGIAIYGMFIGIIIPPARERRALFIVIACAMALSSVFYFTPALSGVSSGFVIIIVTIVAAGAAAVIMPVDDAEDAG